MAASSFAALMALSHSQTQESDRAVKSALQERQRKEQIRRKQQDERESKEREIQAKIRMQRLEQEKKERERQEKRDQEQLAKQREIQRREEEQRQALLHGPKKGKDGGPRWPASSSSNKDDVRRRRLPSDDGDDSGSTALTREEKRKRRLEAEFTRDPSRKRSTTSSGYTKAGRRLPGGAIDITTNSSTPPPVSSSDGSVSVRARLAAMPNTLTKLNVVKRDTRTIDEIVRDRQKLRESKLLEGEEAREFHDWFGSKPKASEKLTPTPVSRMSTPSASTIPGKPSTSVAPNPAPSIMPKKSPASVVKPVPASSSKANPSSALKSAPLPRHPKAVTTSKADNRPSAMGALKPSASLSKIPSTSKLASRSSQPVTKRRQRSPSLSDSPPPPKRSKPMDDISSQIWKLFGKDKDDYMRRDVFSDDEDMEADAHDLEREEMRRSVGQRFYSVTSISLIFLQCSSCSEGRRRSGDGGKTT